MKKIVCVLCALAIVATNSIVASACGYGHDPNLMVKGCSGINATVTTPDCNLRGQYVLGQYHSMTCQRVEYYRYTTNSCTYSGCTYSARSGTHYCEFYHTSVSASGSMCPY